MLIFAFILCSLLIVSSLLSLIYSINGSWERMGDPNTSIWEREKIELKQWGPIIQGLQAVPGGQYRFFGFSLGPWVWLKRRDYGIRALINEGFPENIATHIEGRVFLRLFFKLSSDKLFLRGYVKPFKVEFYEDGTGIKSIRTLDPIARAYRKSELTPLTEPELDTSAKSVTAA